MPGMMDTVLNLGLNEDTLEGLIEKTGDERFAWDSYRRFIQMYGNVVMGIEHSKFEDELEKIKQKRGIKNDIELTVDDLKETVERYKKLYFKEIKEEIEAEKKSVRASFDKVYTRLQSMDNRLIGVAFTLATSAVIIALTVVFRT